MEHQGKQSSNSDRRTSLIKKNIIYSILIKGWSGLVVFLLVPVTLRCLGEYENGVWMTISSLLVWIDNMDIGLGNGLRNRLAENLANNDILKARETVSSTFLMLIFIIIPLSILLVSIISNIDIYQILNVDSQIINNLNNIVVISVILTCTTFIFKFIGNVFMALQLPSVNNLLVCLGQTLSLVGTYLLLIIGDFENALLIIAVINTCAPLVVYIFAYPITFYKLYPYLKPSYKYYNDNTAKSLCGMSLKFFLLQIAGLVLFFSANILISHLFTPAHVTPYQIAYRYFSIVLLAFTIIGSPYWSATTDAFSRGDIGWIKNSRKKLQKIVYMIFSCIFCMVLLSEFVYEIWLGDDIKISLSVTIGMAIYMIVVIWSMSYCYFLNGIGALNLQLIFTIGAAVVFIPLSYVLASFLNDISAVLFALTLANMPSLICNKIQLNKILNNTARGIWIK